MIFLLAGLRHGAVDESHIVCGYHTSLECEGRVGFVCGGICGEIGAGPFLCNWT